MPDLADLRPVLSHYPVLVDDRGARLRQPAVALALRPMAGGLINDTFALGDHHVLQRLHPIFRAEVNHDIAALVRPLRAAGVRVPNVVLADDGLPFVTLESDDSNLRGVWRLLTRLPGATLHRLADPGQARSAARLVARFHAALAPVTHDFAFTRPGAHDTDAHMTTLRRTLDAHSDHRLLDQVAPLATEILNRWRSLDAPEGLPLRIGHGDLKVSNLLFDDTGEANAIIDLDTMAWLSLDAEMGDALRSWCNRAEEHAPLAQLDVDLLAAAVQAYVAEARPWLQDVEIEALVPGLQRITLELSARFAADALTESYFGWNPSVAATRGEHNLLRAGNQLGLVRQVTAARATLDRVVASVR